ncbi:5186_t:CDS:2 [Dentiscutata erythropus]|uniref:Acyl-CoA desaturase n=1 Tax=Dentiscutata erythropus TaxID=1348616 RepID=A0A9N9AY51_9GLOM|nr:5186_t:CDS:2 [Dentiscutata erythropus]
MLTTQENPSPNVQPKLVKKDVSNGSNGSDAWWANGAFVIVVHLISAVSLITYTPPTKTLWLTLILFQLGTFGHRTYTARFPFRLALALVGTLAFQGSIKWWVLRHRLHHRFTDTDHDPYSAAKGFWFSHMGWIFKRPYYPRLKFIDASDLNADPVVVFQHKHYVLLAFTTGLILPTCIAALWGDALGGFLYAGLLGRVIIWHCTFCINSFAHWTGDQLYSNEVSARGNLLLAIMTNGEGYHNFHHEFPKDYRNGYGLFDYDPSKWLIWLFHTCTNQIPFVYRVPDNEVRKARSNMKLLEAQRERGECDWGIDPKTLPTMSYEEFQEKVKNEGKQWLLIDEFVLNVETFKPSHPGGSKILEAYYGKDSTRAFHGGLNIHTKAAKTMMNMFRVARIEKREPES